MTLKLGESLIFPARVRHSSLAAVQYHDNKDGFTIEEGQPIHLEDKAGRTLQCVIDEIKDGKFVLRLEQQTKAEPFSNTSAALTAKLTSDTSAYRPVLIGKTYLLLITKNRVLSFGQRLKLRILKAFLDKLLA